MAKEQVGHFLGTRFVGLRVFELFAYLRGVRHKRYVYYYSLFFADRRIELLDVSVHRRIHLLAVNVPHGKGGRLSGIEQSSFFAACGKSKRYCDRHRESDKH